MQEQAVFAEHTIIMCLIFDHACATHNYLIPINQFLFLALCTILGYEQISQISQCVTKIMSFERGIRPEKLMIIPNICVLIMPLKKGIMFFTSLLGLSVCVSVCLCVCLSVCVSVCLSSGLWRGGWTQQHDITWKYYHWQQLNTATFSRWSVCGSC